MVCVILPILIERNEIMNEIIPSFSASLMDTNITGLGIDLLELGIDSVLVDGVLSEIPIVKTIVGIGKFSQNVRDRNLLIQSLAFIQTFNNGTIKPKSLEKYRNMINSDSGKAEKELGRIVVLLEKIFDKRKSVFLARLFKSYVNEYLDWNLFCEFTEMLELMLDADIETLFDTYQSKGIYDVSLISRKHDRLLNIGLLKNIWRSSGDFYMIPEGDEHPLLMSLSDTGQEFCNIIFNS